MNGIVNRTGPHGVSIVRWSGHDFVTISHSWPTDVTTRACPTNTCVNAVCIIHGSRRRAVTSSSDIAVIPDPESMRTLPEQSRTLREPHDAPRHAGPAPPNVVGCPPYPLSYRKTRQAARPRHARTKRCWDLQASAATRVPAAAPELSEGLVRYFSSAQRSGKHGAPPSR